MVMQLHYHVNAIALPVLDGLKIQSPAWCGAWHDVDPSEPTWCEARAIAFAV